MSVEKPRDAFGRRSEICNGIAYPSKCLLLVVQKGEVCSAAVDVIFFLTMTAVTSSDCESFVKVFE